MRTFGVVLALLVAFIILAPTLRAYVTQQEQLRDLNGQLARTNDEIAAMEAQLARWQDPEFVKAQARNRFSFTLPGETLYRVIDPETVTGDPAAEQDESARASYEPSTADPWYISVWYSVDVAGAAAETMRAEAEVEGEGEAAGEGETGAGSEVEAPVGGEPADDAG
ncbi:FtsB family cell division protein [Salana multivorans]